MAPRSRTLDARMMSAARWRHPGVLGLAVGVLVLALGAVERHLGGDNRQQPAAAEPRRVGRAAPLEAPAALGNAGKLLAAVPVRREPLPAPACRGNSSVDAAHTLRHGGRERSYRLLVPATACDTQPGREDGVPLLVFLHCFGCSCTRDMDDWTREAHKRGFVLARPCGHVAKGPPSWNAGACCGGAAAEKLDDVGFIEAVVRDVLGPRAPAVKIDRSAIYVTGFSNGGFLTSMLARHSSLFAKAAPVSGYEYDPSEKLANSSLLGSVPIMIHHGLRDQHVRAVGCCDKQRCCCGISSGARCVSVDQYFAKWSRINGCATAGPAGGVDSGSGEGAAAAAATNASQSPSPQLPRAAVPGDGRRVVCKTSTQCRAPTTLCIHADKAHGDMLNPGADSSTEHIARFFFE